MGMRHSPDMLGVIGIGILIAVGVILVAVALLIPLYTQADTTLTVTGKETFTTTNCDKDGCTSTIHRMIYTNGETITIDDCLILWKWSSQDRYAHILPGQTYKFHVVGWNFPAIGMFRSSVDEVRVV